jgi:hypothetical protein
MVTDELWEQLTGHTDGSGLLCQPCINQLARAKDITIWWRGSTTPFSRDEVEVEQERAVRLLRLAESIRSVRGDKIKTLFWEPSEEERAQVQECMHVRMLFYQYHQWVVVPSRVPDAFVFPVAEVDKTIQQLAPEEM